jgi:hypothetical protein
MLPSIQNQSGSRVAGRVVPINVGHSTLADGRGCRPEALHILHPTTTIQIKTGGGELMTATIDGKPQTIQSGERLIDLSTVAESNCRRFATTLSLD